MLESVHNLCEVHDLTFLFIQYNRSRVSADELSRVQKLETIIRSSYYKSKFSYKLNAYTIKINIRTMSEISEF